MKKNKETLVQKYFRQTNAYLYDAIAVVLAILGLLIYVFGMKISFLGIPMIVAGVVVKAVDLFTVIKDKEFDEYMDDLKERNIVIYPNEKPDFICEVYDLNMTPVKVGRDQKVRSNIYSFTTFKLEEKACQLEIYKVDALKKEVSHDVYTLPYSCKCEIVKGESKIPKRAMSYLIIKGDTEFKIPAKNDSYDLEEFIKNFK